jgi:hypothetical protein
MVRQPLALEEAHVARLIEGNFVAPAKVHPARRPNSRDDYVSLVRIHSVGPFAREAEQNRTIGSVTLARESERSIKVRLHPRSCLQHPFIAKHLDKVARGRHRPHSVRT